MSSKIDSNNLLLRVLLYHITLINFVLALSGIFDSIANLWYWVILTILALVVFFVLPSTELSTVIKNSYSKNIEYKFIRNIGIIEKIGGAYVTIFGVFYFLDIVDMGVVALPLIPVYLIYCYYWIVYFSKYHESYYNHKSAKS